MPNSQDIMWFKQSFGPALAAALAGTPFDPDQIIAIACQETGHIWSVLRKKPLTLDHVVALCVGDTIDYKGPGKGRQAFPRTKAALLAEPGGQTMFDIARQALVDMAEHIPGYEGAVANPDKFCHGYGVLQYLTKYTFQVRGNHTFTVEEGKTVNVEAVGYEKGGSNTPMEKRPALEFKNGLDAGK